METGGLLHLVAGGVADTDLKLETVVVLHEDFIAADDPVHEAREVETHAGRTAAQGGAGRETELADRRGQAGVVNQVEERLVALVGARADQVVRGGQQGGRNGVGGQRQHVQPLRGGNGDGSLHAVDDLDGGEAAVFFPRDGRLIGIHLRLFPAGRENGADGQERRAEEKNLFHGVYHCYYVFPIHKISIFPSIPQILGAKPGKIAETGVYSYICRIQRINTHGRKYERILRCRIDHHPGMA